MTWHFAPSGETTDGVLTIDVWDHDGTQVATDRPLPEGDRSWGDYPDEVKVVMRENMDGDQPSAYNQSLLADAATDNIEQGVP